MPPIQYIVEGGQRLSGTIEPSGNKNSALPIIAAALLTEHPVTLDNVPRIRDTETLVELVRSVGASAEWTARNTLVIHAKEIRAADLDPELCARIRASILLAGPLLARCGDRHDALHDVLECLGETMWRAQKSQSPPDGEAYVDCVKRKR